MNADKHKWEKREDQKEWNPKINAEGRQKENKQEKNICVYLRSSADKKI